LWSVHRSGTTGVNDLCGVERAVVAKFVVPVSDVRRNEVDPMRRTPSCD
jgi:hypothetical protein